MTSSITPSLTVCFTPIFTASFTSHFTPNFTPSFTPSFTTCFTANFTTSSAVPDALSRLIGDLETPKKTPEAENLDPLAHYASLDTDEYMPPPQFDAFAALATEEAGAFHTMLVKLDPQFKHRLALAYDRDSHWHLVVRMVARAQARNRLERAYMDGADATVPLLSTSLLTSLPLLL